MTAEGTLLHSKLYQLITLPLTLSSAVAAVASAASSSTSQAEECARLWHRRLGHINSASVLHLFSSGWVANPDAANISRLLRAAPRQLLCEPCIKGKMETAPLPQKASVRAIRPLELLHTDVCGPMPVPSLNGMRYFVLIVDDYTRYCFLAPIVTKDQAVEVIQRYQRVAERTHSAQGWKIGKVRSDNGGEFINTALTDYFAADGIQRQRSTAYSPQQNGVVERANRTIVELARTMLTESRLPKSFWALACLCAVHTRNCSPTHSVPSMTPFEAWYGRKPDISNLRPFGCLCFAHIHSTKRDKLDPKAWRCAFVGYSDQAKAYLVYLLDQRVVRESRSVRFLEHIVAMDGVSGAGGTEICLNFPILSSPPTRLHLTQPIRPSSHPSRMWRERRKRRQRLKQQKE